MLLAICASGISDAVNATVAVQAEQVSGDCDIHEEICASVPVTMALYSVATY